MPRLSVVLRVGMTRRHKSLVYLPIQERQPSNTLAQDLTPNLFSLPVLCALASLRGMATLSSEGHNILMQRYRALPPGSDSQFFNDRIDRRCPIAGHLLAYEKSNLQRAINPILDVPTAILTGFNDVSQALSNHSPPKPPRHVDSLIEGK